MIDKDFVYNRFPKTVHDVELLEKYKVMISSAEELKENSDSLSQKLMLFPVYEGTNGNEVGLPVLTRFGFMALSIDREYMDGFYCKTCKNLKDDSLDNLDEDMLRLLRSSLIEFALLGCIEAQQLMTKLNKQFGNDAIKVHSCIKLFCFCV